ncbi:membrane cofactor protein-like [Erinaceus europaeus]|uniref:Membrane cofactor protein-like n=1 Tax=Erinaceus europaeus TaxID=9365 RepID=A0ABM3WCJ0_ERIEU|nr:membrane cofactor protein-like [Erinaceus europaeus]
MPPRRRPPRPAARASAGALRVILALLLPRPVDVCGPPLQFESMRLRGAPKARYSHRERVEYECRPGYQHLLNFSLTTSCSNGSWHPLDEACVRKSCPSPKLENGEVLAPNKTFWFEDEAHFSCDEGYHLIGPKIIFCKHTGNNVGWSDKYPHCQKMYCKPPASIKNGRFSESHRDAFGYSELVTYSCDPSQGPEEYSLVGESRLVCSADGQWSSEPPECKVITCEHPELENGSSVLSAGKLNYQAVVKFECDLGFHLRGSDLAFCGANSTWEPGIPTCVTNRSSQLPGQVTLAPEVLAHRWNDSLPDPSSASNTTSQAIGPVSRQPAIPCKLPVVENGRALPAPAAEQYYEPRATLQLECSPGYSLRGQSTVSCQDNGTWKPELPTCIKVSEPTPSPAATPATEATALASRPPAVQCIYPIVENGRPVTPIEKFYDYRATVQIECYEGFYLSGESTITCGADSIWEPELPACVKVPIAPSPAPPARRLTGTVLFLRLQIPLQRSPVAPRALSLCHSTALGPLGGVCLLLPPVSSLGSVPAP